MTAKAYTGGGPGLGGVSRQQLELLRRGLRIMAAKALGDADLAEDVAQESLLRALRAVPAGVAADPERLGAYVGGIARHVIADARRARGRALPVAESNGSTDPLTGTASREAAAFIREGLQQLPGRDRELLIAAFYEDLSPAEIAARLQIPAVNVRKQKSRALERLRAIVRSRFGFLRE